MSVFLLLCCSLLGQEANESDIPNATSRHRITVSASGRLYFQRDVTSALPGERFSLARLPGLVAGPGEIPATEVIVIKADPKTIYGPVARVLQVLRQAGVTHLSIVIDGAPPPEKVPLRAGH